MTNCPICDEAGELTCEPYAGRSELFSDRQLVVCGDCSFTYISPMPEARALNDYNLAYQSQSHAILEQPVSSETWLKELANQRRAYLVAEIGNLENYPLRILEVGPGFGYLAESFIRDDARIEYFVVETDLARHKRLAEIGAIVTSVEEISDAGLEFDVIIATHVLEHVSDPKNFLRQLSVFLKPNAPIFIEVPFSDRYPWQNNNGRP